jgi:hypothetical protein
MNKEEIEKLTDELLYHHQQVHSLILKIYEHNNGKIRSVNNNKEERQLELPNFFY